MRVLGRPYKVLCSASLHRRAVVDPGANFRQPANFRHPRFTAANQSYQTANFRHPRYIMGF